MKSAVLIAALLASGTAAQAQALRPDQQVFRALYKQMVETDTSDSTGSCTALVRPLAAQLAAAGVPGADVHVIVPEGAPNDANLVAVLPGTDPSLGALVLLAHLDVVDARRADWERDPFTLIEENGYFYGRGASDDKSMAAIFFDLTTRLKREGKPHRRTIKLALTCGEETSPTTVNGVRYILGHQPDLLKGAFTLNEGAGGRMDAAGRPQALEIQSGEKVHQVWRLEVTNPGGHSSLPRPDNAIYQLATAIKKVEAYRFPVSLNPVTREFFRQMGPIEGGPAGAAMSALAKSPTDARAIQTLQALPGYNAVMRTTCVATQIDGGHAANALPQRASATFSCRVVPGVSTAQVKAELQRVVGDRAISFTLANGEQPSNPPPALSPEVVDPIKAAAAKMWPGVPLLPTMSAGATDGRHLNAAGTPTYGLSGMFGRGDSNAHGLNEKIRVKSLYDGRDFLEAVVRAYIQ